LPDSLAAAGPTSMQQLAYPPSELLSRQQVCGRLPAAKSAPARTKRTEHVIAGINSVRLGAIMAVVMALTSGS